VNTPLTIDEASAALAKVVRPRSRWFPLSFGKSSGFEGKVVNGGFNINRAIDYRNSFLPILHGRFHPAPGGSTIEVKMIPHTSVIAFLALWYVLIGGALFQTVVEWRGGAELTSRDLIPLGMLAFVYLMCFFAFGFEARKATEFIQRVFEDDRPNKALQLPAR